MISPSSHVGGPSRSATIFRYDSSCDGSSALAKYDSLSRNTTDHDELVLFPLDLVEVVRDRAVDFALVFSHQLDDVVELPGLHFHASDRSEHVVLPFDPARRAYQRRPVTRTHAARGPGDARDPDDERGFAEVAAVARACRDVRVRLGHDLCELCVHLLLVPAELLDVLRPFEVGDGDSPGVGEDVGDHDDPGVVQGRVRDRCHRMVRGLDHDLRTDLGGVPFVDHLAQRRGDEPVDREQEQIVVRDRVRARQPDDGTGLVTMLPHLLDVEARIGVDPAANVGHGDDLRARLGCDPRRERTHVAEPLHRDGSALERETLVPRVLLHDVHDPTPGRGLTTERSPELDRLSRHARRRVAVALAVGVHHPRHGLRIRVHVGSRDVAVHAEDVADHLRVAAGQLLQLGLAHHVRLALDPALRAAEREVGDRRLPRHQRRKSAHLVDVGRGVVADAALVRTASTVVLDAVAVEDHEVAVVHADGDLDLHLPVGAAQHIAHLLFQVDPFRRLLEEVRDRFVRAHPV